MPTSAVASLLPSSDDLSLSGWGRHVSLTVQEVLDIPVHATVVILTFPAFTEWTGTSSVRAKSSLALNRIAFGSDLGSEYRLRP